MSNQSRNSPIEKRNSTNKTNILISLQETLFVHKALLMVSLKPQLTTLTKAWKLEVTSLAILTLEINKSIINSSYQTKLLLTYRLSSLKEGMNSSLGLSRMIKNSWDGFIHILDMGASWVVLTYINIFNIRRRILTILESFTVLLVIYHRQRHSGFPLIGINKSKSVKMRDCIPIMVIATMNVQISLFRWTNVYISSKTSDKTRIKFLEREGIKNRMSWTKMNRLYRIHI